MDALDQEADFDDAGGLDPGEQDVLLGRPVTGVADPVEAVQKAANDGIFGDLVYSQQIFPTV